MVALLVENLKLVILFLLIGTLIGLSHLSDWKAGEPRASSRRNHAASALR